MISFSPLPPPPLSLSVIYISLSYTEDSDFVAKESGTDDELE